MTSGSPVGWAAAPLVELPPPEPDVVRDPPPDAPGTATTPPPGPLDLPPGRTPAALGAVAPEPVRPAAPGCPAEAPATPPRLAATMASWLMRVPQAADNRTTAVAAPTHAGRRRDRRSGSPVCIRLLEMSALGGIYIFVRIGPAGDGVSTQVRRGSSVTIPGASRSARKEISLAGEVAVVTGGGSGIGAATCR